jgi:hypothetical protein
MSHPPFSSRSIFPSETNLQRFDYGVYLDYWDVQSCLLTIVSPDHVFAPKAHEAGLR